MNFRARSYDVFAGVFIQPDTVVANPANPQSLNRYAFEGGNPLKYRDPTGHWPEWFDSSRNYISGASAQYLDDVSLGVWSSLVVQVDLSLIDNKDYQAGRELGRTVSTVQAAAEMAGGAGVAGAGTAGLAPTITIGVACRAASAGTCGLVAVPAVVVEGGMVVVGGATLAHGTVMMARASRNPVHHVATNKNWIRDPQWSKQFKGLFDKGGLDLNDAVNKLGVPGHTGPHSQGYHEWVYDRLSKAIQGLKDRADIRAALENELNAIGKNILSNPGLLDQ